MWPFGLAANTLAPRATRPARSSQPLQMRFVRIENCRPGSRRLSTSCRFLLGSEQHPLRVAPSMASDPFTTRVFVAAGDPEGILLVDRMNWTGVPAVVPRDRWPAAGQRVD